MGTSFLTRWLSDHEVKAICWTLIHSLWIGVVIALLAGLLISLTRKSSANLRYRVLCGILVLFVMAIGVTYYLEARTTDRDTIISQVSAGNVQQADMVVINHMGTLPQQSMISQAVGFVNGNMNIIFLVWLLFFILKSLKMVSGLLYIQRIRNYKVHEVAEEFKYKMELFSSLIGIRQTVRLMQSEMVKVPVAVGWLKPVILLPMGILLQLSAEQLESILWHELAHIRRQDYLVNILQGVVETIFFFNPGLLWLSSLIRAEREACCDDIVLSRMNRKANYLEALLSFGYEDNSRTALAMSIGNGNQLRDRLKRMMNQENKRLSVVEKVVLGMGLILLSAFTGLPKTTNDAVKQLMHVITKKHVSADSLKLTLTSPKVKLEPVAHLQLSGDTIVKKRDTSIHFTSILFKDNDNNMENNNVRAKDDQGNQYHLIVADGKLTSLEINDGKVKDSELPSYQYIVNNINQALAEKRRIGDLDIAGFKANSPQAKLKLEKLPGKQKWIKEGDPESKFMKDATIREMARRDSIRYDDDRQRVNNVIAELVKAGVVPDAASVKWFGLSDTELIVNGKKQSDELHDRLKAAYGVHKDYGLYYGPVDMIGTGVFIDATTSEARLQLHNLNQLRLKQKQFMLQDKKLMLRDSGLNTKRLKLLSPQKKFLIQQRDMLKLDAQEDQPFEKSISLPPIISNVVTDLVNENIVKNKSDLSSFKLTNSVLVVNGVKQSDELHEKLKSKYLAQPRYKIKGDITRDPDFGLHYDAKQGGMGIGISIDKNDP